MTHPGSDRPIAVIGPHPPFRGGIAHFTERVTQELHDSGRPVLPVSFRRLYPSWLFPGTSQVEAASESSLPAYPWIDSLNPLSWTATATKIADQNALSAAFMYWMPFFAPAYIRMAHKLSRRGVRILSVVHNAIPHERHPGDTFLSARFFNACDSIVALSESVAADIRVLSPETDLRLEPHPVYDRFGDGVDPGEARRRLKLDASDNVLLFFGNVRAYKGLDILLRALPSVVEQIDETVLVVAGEFYDDLDSYRSQIDAAGLADHVRIVNRYIPTDEVGLYFSAADVVIQPYRAATQSGVVHTAQHFGVPVIATDVGGLARDIGAGGIVVKPADPVALAGAIVDFFVSGRRSDFQSEALRIRDASSWRRFVDVLCEDDGEGPNGAVG